MNGFIRFALGLANMPEAEVADLEAKLPGLARIAAAAKQLEPLLRAAEAHAEALQPLFMAAAPAIEALLPLLTQAMPHSTRWRRSLPGACRSSRRCGPTSSPPRRRSSS